MATLATTAATAEYFQPFVKLCLMCLFLLSAVRLYSELVQDNIAAFTPETPKNQVCLQKHGDGVCDLGGKLGLPACIAKLPCT